MIKFPQKPGEDYFWRVRKANGYYDSNDDRIVVVELRMHTTEGQTERKVYGPFEFTKVVKKDVTKEVWSHTVSFDKPFHEYELEYLESAITVAVEEKYTKFIKKITLEDELFGDYE